MLETGVVVDLEGKPIYWIMPPGRTASSLPDSRELWEFIRDNHERISGIAHSHPGGGIPAPSWEDITTFSAVERGIGRRLAWWIISCEAIVRVNWHGPGIYDYEVDGVRKPHPEWVRELRRLSYEI
jgi:proteasome lid subunit RPN8/RPN11